MSRNYQVTPEMSRKAKEQEAERTYQGNVHNYNQLVKQAVTRNSFPCKQFVWTAQESEYGSIWQETICDAANIPAEHEERYWNYGGRILAKKTLSKRRTNTTNQMKAEFLSRCFQQDPIGRYFVALYE
jgi:hypothetical protein